MLRYRVSEIDVYTHEFSIRLEVDEPHPEEQLLTMAAWIPGSYMIRDFARNVTSIAARDAQGPVCLEKLDKQTWRVRACSGPLIVDYRVYALDLSVRSAYLDTTRAYFNGTSVFLRVVGREDDAWTLDLPAPADSALDGWRVATNLPATSVDERGFGRYAGAGYARLIDCPVEIAALVDGKFTVSGVPHRFTVSDGGRFDMGRICHDMSLVCAEHAALFGELPVDSYLFQTLATSDGYGGLEHSDSTSLVCKRSDLPVPGVARIDKGYRQFLGLCSHEYFHLWNVKRIRPASLVESDLAVEAYTELLWAFEGITSYYDELALARSGVLTVENFLDLLATSVSRLLRAPGRSRQSIAESSFDAWTKFYKQDENAPNAIVSYYVKGALVAFGLDVTMREVSDGRFSLDDLMRRLWEKYGRTGVGVPERGIEREVEELLGQPLSGLFARYVYGTEELPLADWFNKLGIGYRTRATRDPDDLGGYASKPTGGAPDPTAIGARFEAQGSGLRLNQVLSGGAAQKAGLAPGDLIIAIDGERATPSSLPDILGRLAGKPARVHFFRRDRLRETHMVAQPAPADTCELWLLPEDAVSADALARRRHWLASNLSASVV